MKDPFQLFLNFIKSVTELPIEEENKILKILHQSSLKKGDVFIPADSIPNKIGFVTSGLFRFYYMDSKGNEYTKGFFAEGSFLVSYTAMVSNTPSFFSIEALEEAHIVSFDYPKWKQLLQGHICWTKFLLAIIEMGYMKKEKREREFLLLDAEERYASFLEDYPLLEDRMKQNMIASYLGITPVALSRIRGQKKRKLSS